MVRRELKPIIFLCSILVGLSGCSRWVVAGAAGAGVGVGTYMYIKGDVVRDYNSPLLKVWTATEATLEQMSIKPESEDRDAFGAAVKAKLYDDKPLDIKLVKKADNLTEVKIRVGFFGDREKSEFIHNSIAANLNEDRK